LAVAAAAGAGVLVASCGGADPTPPETKHGTVVG